MESTCVLLKPDAVQRNLVGEIIARLEKAGFRIVAMKMLHPTREQTEGFYPSDLEWFKSVGDKAKKSYEAKGIKDSRDSVEVGKFVKQKLVEYVSSGPIIAMALAGNNVVPAVRKIVGATDPAIAEKGSIRGDFGQDSIMQADKEQRAVRNLVHASGSTEEAAKEVSYWFSEKELVDK